MIAYNFGSTRYVVSIASAPRILDAMECVEAGRSARIARITNPTWRRVRRLVGHLNPFSLIKTLAMRIGNSMNQVSATAGVRGRRRLSGLVGDLGIVNVLGVPGAGLALSTQGIEISRRHTLRHCMLFVGSWFAGAHVIGLLVAGAHTVPLAGPAAVTLTGTIGAGFARLTDVTTLIGAVACTVAALAILRFTLAVDRAVRVTQPIDQR